MHPVRLEAPTYGLIHPAHQSQLQVAGKPLTHGEVERSARQEVWSVSGDSEPAAAARIRASPMQKLKPVPNRGVAMRTPTIPEM